MAKMECFCKSTKHWFAKQINKTIRMGHPYTMWTDFSDFLLPTGSTWTPITFETKVNTGPQIKP